jgi:hypothetical protein
VDQYCGVDVVLQSVPFGWIRGGHHSLIRKNCTLMIDEEGGQPPLSRSLQISVISGDFASLQGMAKILVFGHA